MNVRFIIDCEVEENYSDAIRQYISGEFNDTMSVSQKGGMVKNYFIIIDDKKDINQ